MTARWLGLLAACVWTTSVTAGSVRAQPRPGAEAYGADARRRLAAALAHCPSAEELVSEPDEVEDQFVRRVGEALLVGSTSSGSGVESSWGTTITMIDVAGCRRKGRLEAGGEDGAIRWGVWLDPVDLGEREPGLLRALLGGTNGRAVVAVPESPAFGAGRLILQSGGTDDGSGGARAPLADGEAWRVSAALAPAQPWRAGAAQPAPETFWSSAQCAALGVAVVGAEEGPPEEPPAGQVTMIVDAPRRTRAAGSFEVWESEMRGRNRGSVVALHDPASGRHRWVLETRIAVTGSEIRWLGVASDLLAGAYVSHHPGYVYAGQAGIVIVDLRGGTAHALSVRGAFEEGLRMGFEDEEIDGEENERAGEGDALGWERWLTLEGGTLRVLRADGSTATVAVADVRSRLDAMLAPAPVAAPFPPPAPAPPAPVSPATSSPASGCGCAAGSEGRRGHAAAFAAILVLTRRRSISRSWRRMG